MRFWTLILLTLVLPFLLLLGPMLVLHFEAEVEKTRFIADEDTLEEARIAGLRPMPSSGCKGLGVGPGMYPPGTHRTGQVAQSAPFASDQGKR